MIDNYRNLCLLVEIFVDKLCVQFLFPKPVFCIATLTDLSVFQLSPTRGQKGLLSR